MDLNRNDILIDTSGVGVGGGDTSSSSSSSSTHLPLIAKEISNFEFVEKN
jgi:hypothetical protein